MTELTAGDTTLSQPNNNAPTISRANLTLLALLIAQALILAWVYWPQQNAEVSGAPLLGDIAPSAVTALSISGPDGEMVSLEKGTDGWVLANTGGFPATADTVDEILAKLVAVTGDRLVTQTPSSHKRLQVADDDFAKQIDLTTSDGGQTLYIGSSAGAGATHVRLSGDDAAYLTGEIDAFEFNTSAANWVDPTYFSVETATVTALTLENANGTFSFTRAAPAEDGTPGAWAPADLAEGEELNEAGVTSILSRVSNVRLVEPLGTSAAETYGLDAPAVKLTLTTQPAEGDAQTQTLFFGSQVANGTDYYAKASTSDYFVTVGSFAVDELSGKTRSDFLVEPAPDAADSETGGE